MRQIFTAIKKGKTALAIKRVKRAIKRVDGCSRRGAPDVDRRKPRNNDLIVSCDPAEGQTVVLQPLELLLVLLRT